MDNATNICNLNQLTTLTLPQLGIELNPPGFWTEKSNEGYKKLSVCIEKQYWNFTAHQLPEGLKINGTRTLDENLADIGGARLAYFGYCK